MLFFVYVSFHIHKNAVSNGFKWATAMIIFGWVGSQLDHLVLASGYSTPELYGNMDWLYAGIIMQPVISITTIMINCGLLLLILVTIIRFKDLRSEFGQPKSEQLSNS